MEEEILLEAEESMEKALLNLEERMKTVRTGRANPSSLDKVMVNYYGVATPLRSLANITVPEARQLLIKPFDKGALSGIEKGIYEANLGYTPNNDGETIRIVIPDLTEERRKELVKVAKNMSEDAKVSVRTARQESLKDIKKAEDDKEISEDVKKDYETQLQKLIDEANKKIEEHFKQKEQDIMKI